MQASFDGAFPDTPLPNLGSGLSRIHVLTFSLFNSFNMTPYYLRNSKCKFLIQTFVFRWFFLRCADESRSFVAGTRYGTEEPAHKVG